MNIRIAKRFNFDAAHQLPKVPEGHKCRRMHGHTYCVEVVLSGPVGDDGMLVDYQDISDAWAPLFDALDHRTLNQVAGLENPTTEVLAHWILARLRRSLPMVEAVRVHESSTTWAEATAAITPHPGTRGSQGDARSCLCEPAVIEMAALLTRYANGDER